MPVCDVQPTAMQGRNYATDDAIAAPGHPLEHLAGSVERVTFHSEETGFCVLRVKVRDQRDRVI